MRAVAVKNSEERGRFTESRPHDYGMENALAKILRRRWPMNTVENTQAEYDLTEGEARGAVYATASRTTLNKILKSRRGGLGLWLEIIAEVTGETLDGFLTHQAKEAADERRRAEERERHFERLEARWRDRGSERPGVPR